jgi:hypothetical protein
MMLLSPLSQQALRPMDARTLESCGEAVLSGLQDVTGRRAGNDHASTVAVAILPLLLIFSVNSKGPFGADSAVPWIKVLAEAVLYLPVSLLYGDVVKLVGDMCRVENIECIRLACCGLCAQLAARLGAANTGSLDAITQSAIKALSHDVAVDVRMVRCSYLYLLWLLLE